MSELKLAIKNFEAIESLQIAFTNSFTCITGSSNNGKSSIFRAVYSLLYNKHTDNSIQQGKESYLVGIEYEGNKVLCKRNSTQAMKTSYQVNDKTITKVGRNNVEEVDKALNMALVDIVGNKVELNITEQFAHPFMLDWNPSKLYTFLSQSSTQDDLYAVLKEMKSDLKDIDDNRKKLEGAVELAKQTYDEAYTIYNNLKDSSDTVNGVLDLQSEVSYVLELESICNRLTLCDTKSLQVDKDLKSIGDILTTLDILPHLDREVCELDVLRSHMTKIKNILIKLKDNQQTYSIIVGMIDKLDFSKIDILFNDINNLEESIRALSNKVEALNNRQEAIIKYEETITDVMGQLDNLDTLDSVSESYKECFDFVSNIKKVIDTISTKDNELVLTTNKINDLDEELKVINQDLSNFKVCPICGKEF